MAQSPFTGQAAWANTSAQILAARPGSHVYQLTITVNQLIACLQRVLAALSGTAVPMTTSTLSIGTTVTIAASASVIYVSGVFASVAALTAQALGALGTIPQNKWGLITMERIANGTTTFVSAAANYTTGYATEALAIAAMPAQSANKAVVGYFTVQAANVAAGWIAGTDALAGGTGGTNPAQTTNYYSVPGAADTLSWANVKQITNASGGAVVTV